MNTVRIMAARSGRAPKRSASLSAIAAANALASPAASGNAACCRAPVRSATATAETVTSMAIASVAIRCGRCIAGMAPSQRSTQ